MGIGFNLSSGDTSSPDRPAPGTPNPLKHNILGLRAFKHCTVVLVAYAGVTNYEGHKVLVFEGCHPDYHALQSATGALDPHFIDPDSLDGLTHPKLIARFRPDKEGLELAYAFAHMYDTRQ